MKITAEFHHKKYFFFFTYQSNSEHLLIFYSISHTYNKEYTILQPFEDSGNYIYYGL